MPLQLKNSNFGKPEQTEGVKNKLISDEVTDDRSVPNAFERTCKRKLLKHFYWIGAAC